MTTKIDLPGIVAELRAADTFLVTTHVAPDGDAIGSVLTTSCLLRAMGKDRVTCALDGPVPRLYRWLPGADRIVGPEKATPPFEVAVIVDVSRRDRIGDVADLIDPQAKTIVIDHHSDEDPGEDVTFIDPGYAAVGAILTELFEAARLPMSSEAAICAYVALATDTGGFRYSNTGPRSHRIAAKLLERGIDVSAISSRIFDAMSMGKFKLLTHVLPCVRFEHDGRVACAEITVRDMADAGAEDEDTDGLINFARHVEGVEVAILLREVDGNTTKVSFRSDQSFDSAALLREFGGGGHVSAAGATLHVPLDAARTLILERVRSLLRGAQ